jgi:hypothetical protein
MKTIKLSFNNLDQQTGIKIIKNLKVGSKRKTSPLHQVRNRFEMQNE